MNLVQLVDKKVCFDKCTVSNLPETLFMCKKNYLHSKAIIDFFKYNKRKCAFRKKKTFNIIVLYKENKRQI